MKLDVKMLRYLSSEDFRVLTAVEMGSKNHEIVPVTIISQIANLRHGGVQRCISSLARRNLVAKETTAKYDGYRLTYGGYDYLALKTLSKRGAVVSVGNQIGVGKESDIYVVADAEGNQRVLKIHRLGRTSFRTVKNNRDYLQGRKSASWMYLSRLSATKEMAFMRVLNEHGFPVPLPVDQNRHCVVMELVDAFSLRQISEVGEPGKLYAELMQMIVRLAQSGLIHGDFNEFNILIKEPGIPILIDFPQMVSTTHRNAEFYFNRDVECIRTYFRRRYQYESVLYPKFTRDANREFSLDVEVAASGFNKKQQKDLMEYIEANDDEDHSDCSEEFVYESDSDDSADESEASDANSADSTPVDPQSAPVDDDTRKLTAAVDRLEI
ncbi:RIO1 family-domain-containing protein [Dimargaris cristalligena]|uniref:Serine/threonine-protein kinase RIO2 n=1 Tax=Dimargaris cristalligena TaxID=215637 RepID=A0A4P9ZSQ1_9FUNG|nr:RIO1 family-domain-containing protein [Dimargaris cristalligena]|eukprot:RKP36606.1 RIO1 family-domain-containing protein [Dimargaris cristalligena]